MYIKMKLIYLNLLNLATSLSALGSKGFASLEDSSRLFCLVYNLWMWNHKIWNVCVWGVCVCVWGVGGKRGGPYHSHYCYGPASRWFPIKWRHFWVTFGHLRSREVISCHVTASHCELQPCRKSNAQHTPVFGLLLPLPGDFWTNDVFSRSLPITWDHVTSFPLTWRTPFASYGLVESQTHSIRQFSAFYSHFKVTSG